MLTVIAGGLIDLETTVTSLIADSGTSIAINETDEIVLTDVVSSDGSIAITAVDDVTIIMVQSRNGSDDNDVSITTVAGAIVAGTIDTGTSGDVQLIAEQGTVSLNHQIIADELTVLTNRLTVDFDNVIPFATGGFTLFGTVTLAMTCWRSTTAKSTPSFIRSPKPALPTSPPTVIRFSLSTSSGRNNLTAQQQGFKFDDRSDEIVIEDNGVVDDGLSQITLGGSSTLVFANPILALVINAEAGDDNILSKRLTG